MELVLPALLFAGVLLAAWGVSRLAGVTQVVEGRMARYASGPETKRERREIRKKRKQVDPFATLSADLDDKRFAARVRRDLARANLKLRVSEYYYIRIGAAAGAGLLLWLLRDPMYGLIGLALGYFAPRLWVGRRIGGRLGAFNKQLADTITLISNSLRAGSSFLQSIELVSRESAAPMGEEMARVVREVNLGLSMEEALQNLVRRIRSEDVDLMVTAIGIQQQVGGNLAEILDTIAFTIRERIRIKGEIKTLTAQGRISGYMVAGLPIALGGVLNLINPAFMDPLFSTTIGRILIGLGVVLMTIGFFIIRKITDIRV